MVAAHPRRHRREVPGEPEVDLLAARASFLRGDRAAARQHMQDALQNGASEARCNELLLPLGITLSEMSNMRDL